MGKKTRALLVIFQCLGTIVVWEVVKAGFTAANPLALSTLKPASVAVAHANTRDDKRLTAVRNKLRQTKAELDTLLAARAKQTIKETLSVTPIKDELQKQGNIQAEPDGVLNLAAAVSLYLAAAVSLYACFRRERRAARTAEFPKAFTCYLHSPPSTHPRAILQDQGSQSRHKMSRVGNVS